MATGYVLIVFFQALAACLSVSSFWWRSPCKIVGGDNLTQINKRQTPLACPSKGWLKILPFPSSPTALLVRTAASPAASEEAACPG